MTAVDPTTPTTLSPAEIAAQAQQALSAAGGTASPGIGLSLGEKPVGIGPQGPQSGPGLEALRGQVDPAEANAPQTQFGTSVRAKPYQEGDQFQPGLGTPAQIAQMQAQLVQAGLLSATNYRAGVWGPEAADAYKLVLSFANTHGMNANDALGVLLASPPAGTTPYRAPMSLTNPADITNSFETAVQQLTGGAGIPASESQAFASYQTGLEQSARDRYVSAKTAKDSAYVGAPSPGASAKAYILAHNQQDVVNYDLALRTIQFHNALGEL